MKRSLLGAILLVVLMAAGVAPFVRAENSGRSDRLLELLAAKGVLSAAELADLREGGDGMEARLIDLLTRKGVLTAVEAADLQDNDGPAAARGKIVIASTSPLAPAPVKEPSLVLADTRQPVAFNPVAQGQRSAPVPVEPQVDPLSQPPDFGSGEVGITARALVPNPVEPLPLLRPFAPTPLTLRIGSGVTVNPYGIIKATTVHDSNLSSGDDFPFFGRVVANGPETANTTGTLAPGPDFRVKARSTRLGVDIVATDPNERFNITGKVEFDFEGSFPSATNRNIGAIRSSEASIRLAWVRLDKRVGSVPVFLKFGQDATLFGSSTQPTGIETTGNYLWQGNVNERTPGFVGGMRFDMGGAWNWRLEPESGIFLPSGGEYIADVIPSPRWGSGLGSAFAQNNPAPGQGTTGFGQREGTNSGKPRYEGRMVLEFEPWPDRKIPPSQLIASFQFADRERYFAPPYQQAGRSFGLRSHSNGYTGEFRLATPWWTMLGKYYHGSDLRYYFGGVGQDVFFDGGDPFVATADTPRMLPVRAQGGFVQLQLPLSVWFNPSDPRLHGFSMNLMAGYDSAFARDARRSGQRKGQGALMANFLYQYNRYIQFGFETDYIETFYTDPQGGPGLQGRTGKNLRFEVGPTFTF